MHSWSTCLLPQSRADLWNEVDEASALQGPDSALAQPMLLLRLGISLLKSKTRSAGRRGLIFVLVNQSFAPQSFQGASIRLTNFLHSL